MRRLISAVILLFVSTSLFSQTTPPNGLNDTVTLKIKLKEYTFKLREADLYEGKAEAELLKINFFNKEARALLDSATVVARRAQFDAENSKLYLMQFNMLYNMSANYAKQADSTLKVAQSYKDTAGILNKQAETFYLKVADEYKYVMQTDTSFNVIYTVQLGAGNMVSNYFEKVHDVEIVTPSDGIKRFVTGRFRTKEEAMAYRLKMTQLGYTDAFIRTTTSLNY